VLDIEGYEVEALKGAAGTIERCRPIIHLEEWARSKAAIRQHMVELNYLPVAAVHGDVIYRPR
jgi:hypothetical protein